jgi:hypothetical protein
VSCHVLQTQLDLLVAAASGLKDHLQAPGNALQADLLLQGPGGAHMSPSQEETLKVSPYRMPPLRPAHQANARVQIMLGYEWVCLHLCCSPFSPSTSTAPCHPDSGTVAAYMAACEHHAAGASMWGLPFCGLPTQQLHFLMLCRVCLRGCWSIWLAS